MRGWFLIMWLLPVLNLGVAVSAGAKPCMECHPKQQAEFQKSAMAIAAITATFLEEWQKKGQPEACLACHSPTRSTGVTCIDCHGGGSHPYPRLRSQVVCARCHDAPGEITLRSYRNSPAYRRGDDCLTCHVGGEVFNHDFKGPSRPGFLRGIAHITIAFRRDAAADTALIRIRHKAGHALPGGTTGRSVWLLVEQTDTAGRSLRQHQYRFGWLHSSATGWRENTLPPGVGKVIETRLRSDAMGIRVKLIYRFRAGGLDRDDPDQVTLAEAVRTLSFREQQERSFLLSEK